MCALFGWLDYKGIVPYKVLKRLTQALANAAEERGTDAAGISYIKDGKVTIFKRPKPAHKIHFNPPEDTTAIMGHTRMATQGDKSQNFNNHPFSGTAGDTSFAFAHNGVLWNDRELRHNKNLLDTHIETDSYIAVQLLESQDKLDFDSLKYMAETVEGNFTFTVLDQNNSLYIIKGSNPMCLLHFEALGLYIYASTESIMKNALRKVGLYKFASEKVEVVEGDILRISRNGENTKSQFEPKLYRSKCISWYSDDEPYYGVHEEMLLAYCGCYGVDSSDVELLLEYGYTCDEIEDMLADHALLHETLQAIKFEDGENIYEECYGGVLMGRNANGEGSIIKDKRGFWRGAVSLPCANGKYKKKYVYGKTRKEVAEKMNEIISQLRTNTYIEPCKTTLYSYLCMWLETYCKNEVRMTTYVNYETYVHKHIKDNIGGYRLCDLSTIIIQQFYNEKGKNGKLDGSGGLSPKTMKNIHDMLHRALDQAVKLDMIAKNPSDFVVLPKRKSLKCDFSLSKNSKCCRKLSKGIAWKCPYCWLCIPVCVRGNCWD